MPATALPYADADCAIEAAFALNEVSVFIERGLLDLNDAVLEDDERRAVLAYQQAKLDIDRAAAALALVQAEFAKIDRSASLRCPIPAGTEAL